MAGHLKFSFQMMQHDRRTIEKRHFLTWTDLCLNFEETDFDIKCIEIGILLPKVFQPHVICLAKLIISQQTSSSAELFFSVLRLSNKVIALSKFHDVILTKLMNCILFFHIILFMCVPLLLGTYQNI